MSAELVALALSGLLALMQLALMAVRANMEIGPAYFLTPRDEPPPRPLSQGTARLKRAYDNHLEALPVFAVAVLAVVLAEKSSAATAALAWLHLLARVVFVPAYFYGWVPWRSVFYGLGYVASAALLIAALI